MQLPPTSESVATHIELHLHMYTHTPILVLESSQILLGGVTVSSRVLPPKKRIKKKTHIECSAYHVCTFGL